MPALDDILREKLHALDAQHLQRHVHSTTSQAGAWVERDGVRLLSFCSNDYLGLSRHPQVIHAAEEAPRIYGTGAGASRLVSGNHPLYAPLESSLAHAKSTEAALVFGSGYLANLGTITALVGKGDLIVADRLVHACMIDGAQLSGAKLLRFAHNDLADATRILETHRAQYRHCLILTETIFSMDGDLAPLDAILALASTHDAWVLSDDAHGIPYTHASSAAPNHVQLGTLSKAIGAYGGYVCGSRTLIDYLTTTARSFIFTTGLPPATLAAAATALELIHSDEALRSRPLALAKQLTHNLGLPPAQSQIVPIIVGDSATALQAAEQLKQQHILISAIRPPTVPQGSARLRITLSAAHTDEELLQLMKALRPLVALQAN